MLISILTFIIVLSVLVLVHEFGHFIAARRAGIWVEEFGFGLPPKILGKKIGSTLYSINLLPFGGFVRLHGENTMEDVTLPEKAFLNKSKGRRAVIILAGVFMNFLLSIFAFSVSYSFTGVPRKTNEIRVVEAREESPAKAVGLMAGDTIVGVNDQKLTSNKEFIDLVEGNRGKEISLSVKKGETGEIIKVSTTPRENPPEGEGALGVIITDTEIYFPPVILRPFYGVYYGVKESLFWGGVVVTGFGKMIVELFGGTIPQDIAGPVGIFALTSQAAQYGLFTLINFVGILSINLAILNAIPFPALDGGRLLFIGIETVFGRKVVPKVESIIHMMGMIILILLVLAITAHDIQKLVSLGGISGYIDSIIK